MDYGLLLRFLTCTSQVDATYSPARRQDAETGIVMAGRESQSISCFERDEVSPPPHRSKHSRSRSASFPIGISRFPELPRGYRASQTLRRWETSSFRIVITTGERFRNVQDGVINSVLLKYSAGKENAWLVTFCLSTIPA
jgi:hypothetical protein